MGLDAARQTAADLIGAAEAVLAPWGEVAGDLQAIARFAIVRRS
jgi:hypothetical protein